MGLELQVTQVLSVFPTVIFQVWFSVNHNLNDLPSKVRWPMCYRRIDWFSLFVDWYWDSRIRNVYSFNSLPWQLPGWWVARLVGRHVLFRRVSWFLHHGEADGVIFYNAMRETALLAGTFCSGKTQCLFQKRQSFANLCLQGHCTMRIINLIFLSAEFIFSLEPTIFSYIYPYSYIY